MDIYTPDNDTLTERPVVIYLFGGAYINGSKNNTDCVDYNYFAKRGYVAIAANYRLSNNPILFSLDQQHKYSTVLKAIADLKILIRYIKKDHIQSNILKLILISFLQVVILQVLLLLFIQHMWMT